MKQTFLFSLLVICLSLVMSSCGNKAETTSTDSQTMTADSMGATIVPVAAETPGEQGVPGQAHYKCTKAGCTGTGTAAGKCPVCGTDLEHNTAFHGTPAANPGATPGATPQTAVTLDPATGKPAVTPVAGSATPPPAKNEAGVYHFACSKAGCNGGGAAAGKCPKCGGDLAHNQAYHNK